MSGPVSQAEYLARRAAEMSEAQLQQGVLQLAARMGWMAYHTHDSRRSQPGFPDLVLVRAGRILFRELKTQKGKLRPEQRTWLYELEAGGDAAIWRPADLLNGTVFHELQTTARRHP